MAKMALVMATLTGTATPQAAPLPSRFFLQLLPPLSVSLSLSHTVRAATFSAAADQKPISASRPHQTLANFVYVASCPRPLPLPALYIYVRVCVSEWQSLITLQLRHLHIDR